MANYLFTSESVSEGHPDKIADQISDAILDACLKEDRNARVACETMVSTGLVMVAGEVSMKGKVKYLEIVRETIHDIGYHHYSLGFVRLYRPNKFLCKVLTIARHTLN